MMDKSISSAPQAFRGLAGSAFGGLRLTNPLVNDNRPAQRPAAEASRYTPSQREGGPLASPAEGRPGRPNAAIASYEAVRQSISYERNNSFDLSIRTAEGDVASIRIAQAHSESSSVNIGRYATPQGQGGELALSSRRSDSIQFEISVSGDLNDAETASINALLQKAQGVADDFFAGNVEQATTVAQGLALNGDAPGLAAFSFELQSRESLRATTAYASVAAIAAPAAEFSPPAPWAVDKAPSLALQAAAEPPEANFLRQLLAMFENVARSAAETAGPARGENNQPRKPGADEPKALPPAPQSPSKIQTTA